MASKNTSFHEGPLAGVLLSPLKLAFSVGLGLVAILLVAWSIDWMFVSRVRPDGVDRLHSLLAADLGHGISLAARQGRGAGEITGPANLLYGLVFEVTGIQRRPRLVVLSKAPQSLLEQDQIDAASTSQLYARAIPAKGGCGCRQAQNLPERINSTVVRHIDQWLYRSLCVGT